MTRGDDFVDTQFTVSSDTKEKTRELQRLMCNHCKKYEIRRHQPRLRNHLMECPDVPEEIKEELESRGGNDSLYQ